MQSASGIICTNWQRPGAGWAALSPTGYAYESVKSITVDGKTKKTCNLKLLPDEIEIIEAELFAPESDFDGVPAGSQEKGQVLLHKLQ